MARYQQLEVGVFDAELDRAIGPLDPEWRDYLAWLQDNTPDPPPPPLPQPSQPDRSYYTRAGDARKARELAALTDAEFLTQLRKAGL